MKVAFTWKPLTSESGSICYVGPYAVAKTYDAITQRDAWRVMSLLPGIVVQQSLNHFTSDADARTVAELLVQKWFDRIEPALTVSRKPQKSED